MTTAPMTTSPVTSPVTTSPTSPVTSPVTTSPVTTDSPVAYSHTTIITMGLQHGSVVVATGSSITLACTTNNEDVPFWDYYPYSSSQLNEPTTIYNGGKQGQDLDSRFVLDVDGCRVNRCTLRIENIQLKDAGRFVCLDQHSDLSLTVLGRYKTQHF